MLIGLELTGFTLRKADKKQQQCTDSLRIQFKIKIVIDLSSDVVTVSTLFSTKYPTWNKDNFLRAYLLKEVTKLEH